MKLHLIGTPREKLYDVAYIILFKISKRLSEYTTNFGIAHVNKSKQTVGKNLMLNLANKLKEDSNEFN
jgi:hypothetical protein